MARLLSRTAIKKCHPVNHHLHTATAPVASTPTERQLSYPSAGTRGNLERNYTVVFLFGLSRFQITRLSLSALLLTILLVPRFRWPPFVSFGLW